MPALERHLERIRSRRIQSGSSIAAVLEMETNLHGAHDDESQRKNSRVDAVLEKRSRTKNCRPGKS